MRTHSMNFIFAFLVLAIFWVHFGADEAELDEGQLKTVDNIAIIGGEETKPHEFPYLVDIRRFSPFWRITIHACSGVIIHPRWILTAAHCLIYRFYMLIVVAGKHDNSPFVYENSQRMVKAKGTFLAQNFDFLWLEDDIALLRLATPLEFNEYIKSVPLPKPGFIAKGMATVAGWGTYKPQRNSSNFLMKVALPIISKKDCRGMYGPKDQIFDTSLCAGYIEGGKDACDGNSGGGLFCKEDENETLGQTGNTVLCGILSWGKGCALPKTPVIFTEVSNFLEWINDTMTKYT